MSREVRMVPKNWEHPKENGSYVPLFDGYNEAINEFEEMIKTDGIEEAIDYYGGGPSRYDYMPDWPQEERTHYMMYETTSEGTPISPALETPEELARWLADNKASSFGSGTASYDQWLKMIKGSGWSVSAVMDSKGFRSGVEE